MTIQTAVLIETLVKLGADVDGHLATSFQRKIMQPQQLQKQGIPVYAWKGKQKKNIGGVSNKQLKEKKIGNQICF